MNKSIKAALVSALVFPGAGQIVLKRYGRGTALILVSLGSLVAFTIKAFQTASEIADQLNSDDYDIDIPTITAAVNHSMSGMTGPLLTVATLLFVACWIGGIADALWIGKQKQIKPA